ncbi:tetratricopeptide repeat protein [bacterium SCSIO 12741]|nr:tetratricopeptide repeat protein [bacterium SCSIO 12741]
MTKPIFRVITRFLFLLGSLGMPWLSAAQTPDTEVYTYYSDHYNQYRHSQTDSSRLYLDSMNRSVVAISDSVYHAYNDLANGAWYWIAGDLDSALFYYFRSLKLSQTHQYDHLTVRACNGLGILYIDLGEWEWAEKYQRQSLELGKQRKDRYAQMLNLINLGVIYQKQQRSQESLEHLNQALHLADSLSDSACLALSYQNKALVFSDLGEGDSAVFYGRRGLYCAQQSGDRKAEVHCWINASKGYLIQGFPDSARWAADKALKYADELEFTEGQKDAHRLWKDLEQQAGNHKAALFHAEQAKIYEDSLYSLRKMSNIKALEKKQVTEEAQRDLASTQNFWKRQLNKRQKLLTWLAIALLVILVLAMVYMVLYRKSRLKGKQKEVLWDAERKSRSAHIEQLESDAEQLHLKLEEKEKHLLTYTLELERKQKIIRQVEEKLATGNPGREEAIELRTYLKSTQLNEQEWKEFNLRFEAVHQSFFQKLTQLYPGLSSTDLKLCAFLRMNLSSKQMASLLNIAPQSVDMARYRLRKKLGLSSKDGLSEVIHSI